VSRATATPSLSRVAKAVEAEFVSLGESRRAEKEKAYLKSDLRHLGIRVPEIRREVRTVLADQDISDRNDVLTLTHRLWSRPIHEMRMAAVELLVARSLLLKATDMQLLERYVREAKTWALVDALATSVVGPVVEEHRRLCDRWTAGRDADFLVRRASLLALLKPLRAGGGDFERFTRYADSMLEEKEFFVRKAIGWVLRETSKKRPKLVYEWLFPRAEAASGVTIREAIRYLPPSQRERVLRVYEEGRRKSGASRRKRPRK
jgi:3-methyladenine DNA glycosylase AlkD